MDYLYRLTSRQPQRQQQQQQPMEPCVQRPLARKPSNVKASPLKKQSDYQLVAPLKQPTAARPPPPAPSATANRKLAVNPTTPVKQPIKKERKKFLCDTPPAVLQDTRGRTEYDRGKQLGEGGFARCFIVQNKDGSMFAAKTVAKKSLQSQKMKAKFFGEIQVHKTMIHPNIVRFVECFEDTENIYMILELCTNRSLMEMLRRRKRFTEPETRFFLLQLLGALKYMHGKRVIHRDLKLGNIFLDENMNIKIGDFGLAALLVSEDERKRTICGTPNYIAPEVLFGGGREGDGHSFEVDLWGVGIIMYAMLVGKPPFQSTDVDSIYQKIRHNTFDWPETINVSLSAKSLVNALLNSDPTARPSLDDIASHHFFKTGFFPKSIPITATKQEPIWPATTQMSGSRQESKRNYEEVAKGCGIGFDFLGNPIECVGDRAGKTLDPVEIPASRPNSATSSDKELVDAQALLEKIRKETVQRKANNANKENGGYILPEALSPRDGHARMRNVNVLKKIPSRLGPSRGGLLSAGLMPTREASVPEAPKAIPEVEEDEPVLPERRLRQRPVRSSAAAIRPSVFPPKRPVTRSHAAEQRAANVPEVAPVPPKPQARRVTRQISAEVVPQPVEVKAERQTREPSRSPPAEVIPYTPQLTSRVGRPIPTTTTSAVMNTLLPFIKNLTAFTTSNMSSLPPQPRDSVNAVNSYHRGEKNRFIYITKWVDYTNKYGVAYCLTDGTCAALYNDNTSIVVDSCSGEQVEFITQSFADPEKEDAQETVLRRLCTDMPLLTVKSKTSKGLANKVMMWRRFSNYMKQNLAEENTINREGAVRESSLGSAQSDDGMMFVTHYARLRRCTVFRFSDGCIQFNFVDHIKIILSSSGRTLRIIKSDGLTVLSLEEAHNMCFPQRGTIPTEDALALRKKIGYIRDILREWWRKRRFPGDIEFEPRTVGDRPMMVLGEAS